MASGTVVGAPLSQTVAEENNEVLKLLVWVRDNRPTAFRAICRWATNKGLTGGVFPAACREYNRITGREIPQIQPLSRVAPKRIHERGPDVYFLDETPFVAL